MLKELFKVKKKRPLLQTKLLIEKLTGKGKHKIKVGNHLHTNMVSKPATVRREHKCRIREMHLKLKDQQLKTILFIYRLLYQNLTVITNCNSTIDTHTKKKKDSKHNTEVSHEIGTEDNKRGREKKDLQKEIQNI